MYIQPDVLLDFFEGLYFSMTEFYRFLSLPLIDVIHMANNWFPAPVTSLLEFIADNNSYFSDVTLFSFIIGGSISGYIAFVLVKWFKNVVL